MAEPTILTPIELTDAELDAVSGGILNQHVSNRTRQSIFQRITETGGSLTVGGGSSTVAFNGTINFTETFTASETASNTNTSTQTSSISGTNTVAV